MKKLLKTTFVASTFLILNACVPLESEAKFNLLPASQVFNLKSKGQLRPKTIKNYFSKNETPLPPLPESLKDLSPAKVVDGAQIVFDIDSTLTKTQGYSIDISKKQVHIIGTDRQGLFYAFQTLEELIKNANDQQAPLPECHILDYPLLDYRAIHLDVKHHLEKMDYYYDLIDKLAKYKINAIILEIEDKLKYRSEPKVASSDVLSIDDWKKISDYAHSRYIEISPLVQGLGYASFVLKHDTYKALRDTPGSDWAFNPLDPKTYKV